MKSFVNEPILALLQLKPLPIISNSWIFYWLIALSIILITLKLLFPKRLVNSLLALINVKSLSIIRQDGFVPSNIVNILLTLIYIFAFGLLVSAISSYYYLKEEPLNWDFNIAISISLIVTAFIAAKIIFIFITQWIYQAKEIGLNYLNVLVLSYNMFGVVIFFGLWLIFYVNFNIGLIFISTLLCILFVIRLLKLSSLSEVKNNFSLFSFIVYICTVEILPLIIAQKLYFYWVLAV